MRGYFGRLAVATVAALTLAAATGAARAQGDRAGDFDYYVLALSWSPNWCARRADSGDAAQCTPGAGFGWLLHGLWPQHEAGWPADCATDAPWPTRAESAAMADLMGSGGLAFYQWRKHGRCTGLAGRDYYRLARTAFERVTRPPVLRQLDDPVRLPAAVVEDAFLEANPALAADMITITCRDGAIQEARICLDRGLLPRPCGADIRRDCALDRALLHPIP